MTRFLTAEVEHVTRSIVTVDIEQLLASDWAEDRPQYSSDEEFAKGTLRKIGYRDLLDPQPGDEVGIAIEGEYDEGEIAIVGVHEA